MDSSREFLVRVKREEVVAAVLPVQEHWVPMSNLDLLLPALDVGVFFCYKNIENDMDHAGTTTSTSTSSSIVLMKKALAQALVHFYAFAGEVVQNHQGEPELHCNNRGVDFVEAFADVELKHLDLHHPDHSVQAKLVPIKKAGVLSVQVTELKCGGLVIGCSFDHRVADAYSANMFFVTWADNNNNNNIHEKKSSSSSWYEVPCFRRSLLNPRHPCIYDASFDDLYVLLPSQSLENNNNNQTPSDDAQPSDDRDDILISRIYYVPAEQVCHLQNLASSSNNGTLNNTGKSKLVSFTAFLWKMIAESGCDDKKVCKMGIVVDGRGRLERENANTNTNTTTTTTTTTATTTTTSTTTNNNNKPRKESLRTMKNYFGNVLSIPYGEASVGELKKMSLGRVADAVHEWLAPATTAEHFLGLIDWVEHNKPKKGMVKIYCHDENNEAAVVVSSGLQFPLWKMKDNYFGCGNNYYELMFGSYHFPWGGQTGYVMPMPSIRKSGDWIVYMHLLKKHLDLVDKEASHIFKPLNPSYLNLV